MATRVTPTPGITADGWVSLGVVARAHGLKGAVKLHLWDGDGAVLRPGLEVRVGDRTRRVVSYAAGLLQLEGVVDRTAAEGLQGRELLVRRADFPVDEASTYLVDLVGAEVRDEAGRLLGHVRAFSDNTAQVILEVATAAGTEVLVPFVAPIVVQAEQGVVVLRPPGGMFDDDVIVDEPDAT